ARVLLTRDLPVMAAGRERELLDLTGRWTLLLNLVTHPPAADVGRGPAVGALRWQGGAGLTEAESQLWCERLDGLSLLALAWAGEARVLVIHDVIRDFALSRLGPDGQAGAHAP